MIPLVEAVDRLTTLLDAPSLSVPTLKHAVYEVVLKAENASVQDIEMMLRQMNRLMERGELASVAIIAMGCGALIEQGADAEIVRVTLLKRTLEALLQAPPFGLACREEALQGLQKDNSSDLAAYIRQYGEQITEQVTQKLPLESHAWFALEPLSVAVMAIFERLPYIKDAIRSDTFYMTAIQKFPVSHPGVKRLQVALSEINQDEAG